MMSSWRRLSEEASSIAPLVIICQDYIALEDEFSKNPKVKKNNKNPDFWMDMAVHLYGKIKMYLQEKIDPESDGDIEVGNMMIMKFTVDMSSRFELNDLTYDAIKEFLSLYQAM